jgi:hypothetical protein
MARDRLGTAPCASKALLGGVDDHNMPRFSMSGADGEHVRTAGSLALIQLISARSKSGAEAVLPQPAANCRTGDAQPFGDLLDRQALIDQGLNLVPVESTTRRVT